MLLVVFSWSLLFCWEVCGRHYFASPCCVALVKMTGSVLSQTPSVDVNMECFSLCWLGFLIVISHRAVTFRSACTDAVASNVPSPFLHTVSVCDVFVHNRQERREEAEGRAWPRTQFSQHRWRDGPCHSVSVGIRVGRGTPQRLRPS